MKNKTAAKSYLKTWYRENHVFIISLIAPLYFSTARKLDLQEKPRNQCTFPFTYPNKTSNWYEKQRDISVANTA